MKENDLVFKSFPYDTFSFFVRFPLFVVYEHPADYPDKYVVRLWDLNKPTDMIAIADTYEALLKAIPTDRMCRWGRTSIDDPCIVETWF